MRARPAVGQILEPTARFWDRSPRRCDPSLTSSQPIVKTVFSTMAQLARWLLFVEYLLYAIPFEAGRREAFGWVCRLSPRDRPGGRFLAREIATRMRLPTSALLLLFT